MYVHAASKSQEKTIFNNSWSCFLIAKEKSVNSQGRCFMFVCDVHVIVVEIHLQIIGLNLGCQGSQFAIFQGGTFTPFLMFLAVFSPPSSST